MVHATVMTLAMETLYKSVLDFSAVDSPAEAIGRVALQNRTLTASDLGRVPSGTARSPGLICVSLYFGSRPSTLQGVESSQQDGDLANHE
jgi:hypothetical protein